MKRTTVWIPAAALVILTAHGVAPHAATAQPVPQATLDTADPVEIGNKVLPPGRYLIRVVPENENRNLLQVTDEEGQNVLCTVLSVPHYSLDARDDSESRFVYYPAVAGLPKVLRTWYEAENSEGHDIVYPRDRAQELAELTKVPVTSVASGTDEDALKKALLETMKPDEGVTPFPPPPPDMVASNEPMKEMPEELPRTASDVPLVGLLGALSLGSGILVRAFRRTD